MQGEMLQQGYIDNPRQINKHKRNGKKRFKDKEQDHNLDHWNKVVMCRWWRIRQGQMPSEPYICHVSNEEKDEDKNHYNKGVL